MDPQSSAIILVKFEFSIVDQLKTNETRKKILLI